MRQFLSFFFHAVWLTSRSPVLYLNPGCKKIKSYYSSPYCSYLQKRKPFDYGYSSIHSRTGVSHNSMRVRKYKNHYKLFGVWGFHSSSPVNPSLSLSHLLYIKILHNSNLNKAKHDMKSFGDTYHHLVW